MYFWTKPAGIALEVAWPESGEHRRRRESPEVLERGALGCRTSRGARGGTSARGHRRAGREGAGSVILCYFLCTFSERGKFASGLEARAQRGSAGSRELSNARFLRGAGGLKS